jgi:hypothetical protein
MKGAVTIARIRREFFVRGRAIKEIVRELHVSRNTVRKVLRSGATRFSTSVRISRGRSWVAGRPAPIGFWLPIPASLHASD